MSDAVSCEVFCSIFFPWSCSPLSFPVFEQCFPLEKRSRSFLRRDSNEEYVLLDKTGPQRGKQAQMIAVPFSTFVVVTFGANDTRELSGLAYMSIGRNVRVLELAR